ncbi:hypothetical protein AB0C34_15475, partial [Nocardia sp. NPDC049220]|uniref:hypothetical protein n=1 Tax=Nocardia sp. NPDC049220 TaxID=3155273 RepID=UPI003409F69C
MQWSVGLGGLSRCGIGDLIGFIAAAGVEVAGIWWLMWCGVVWVGVGGDLGLVWWWVGGVVGGY